MRGVRCTVHGETGRDRDASTWSRWAADRRGTPFPGAGDAPPNGARSAAKRTKETSGRVTELDIEVNTALERIEQKR